MNARANLRCVGLFCVCLGIGSTAAFAAEETKPEFPPFEKVSEGFVEVLSTADGTTPFYRLWKRDKDAQLLAELPEDFESRKFFIVPTVAGGDTQLGVYSIWHYLIGQDARYVHWKRYDKKLALLEPNLQFRTSGDLESRRATERVYTDTVVLTAPIVCMGPGGGPVIDLDDVLIKNSSKFFGRFTRKADFGLQRSTPPRPSRTIWKSRSAFRAPAGGSRRFTTPSAGRRRSPTTRRARRIAASESITSTSWTAASTTTAPRRSATSPAGTLRRPIRP